MRQYQDNQVITDPERLNIEVNNEKNRDFIAQQFVDNFVKDYQHKNPWGYGVNYNPQADAEAFRGIHIEDLFVTFSIVEGKSKCICSFWGMKENDEGMLIKRRVNIDLTETIAMLIKHYYSKHYRPMPKWEDGA